MSNISNDRIDIPAIITTDLSSTHDLVDSHLGSSRAPTPDSPVSRLHTSFHARSPSDPAFLAPSPILRGGASSPGLSTHSPSTTVLGSDDGHSHNPPPSPTLSAHSGHSSVHFDTSLALRNNKPENHTGLSSLNMLTPDYQTGQHRRKPSWSSVGSSSEGTEPDIPLSPVITPSPTRSRFDASDDADARTVYSTQSQGKLDRVSTAGEPLIGHEAAPDVEHEVDKHAALDLSKDDEIDTGKFAFKPFHLAALVDPKSLPALKEMGGVTGVLKGLGTNRKRGLGRRALVRDAQPHHSGVLSESSDGRPGAGLGASQRHRPPSPSADVPDIRVISPGDDGGGDAENVDENKGDAYDASLDERQRVYGINFLPSRKTKNLLQLMWLALKDKVLVLLSIAAVVSLALGFFQDFGTPRPADEPPVDWVEGVAIIVAIAIVVMVGSINDWQKERQFQTLNDKKEERGVKVVRDGVETIIDIKEVVVGDIAILEPGEIIPCDGIFLTGHNVKCDESGATGESDAIKKVSYEDCLRAEEGAAGGDSGLKHTDCFMVSGSKVLEGYGSYVVIAVGTRSFNGRIMMALRGDTESTPLQLKLNDLAELIAKLGTAAGVILFTALMIRFFVQLGTNNPERTANAKGIAFVQILIISVTLIVVAVPEGLPLAVTLALAFATKRMTKENLLVRVLGSCETMANASVVCTDKTGTLTQNAMTIVAGSIGIRCKFVHGLEQNKNRTNAGEEAGVRPEVAARKHAEDFSVDESELNTTLSPAVKELLNSSIAINSTAFEDHDEKGELVFVGSKTETALLKFAKDNHWPDYKMTRESANIIQMIPFSSERKAMGVVVKLGEKRWRLFLKGASEILTKKCTRYIEVRREGEQGPSNVNEIETKSVDELARDNISRTTIFYANQMLRAIAICYRDFESWPPPGASYVSEDEVSYDDISNSMTLIGIVGIEDPLREGVREAVAQCHKAGVQIKMCTGDNVLTARSIALQCGIYTAGGIIMEGPIFRQLSEQDRMELVPRLQVLARSSPEDKKILVETLRQLGEIVGVTGDGTNDGPALKTADVGFSMGIAGTEVAKEASDIILMDDNFSSIVKAIMWGRCVNDAVRKFLQFQISTNITAVIITFVSAVASAEESSVLSAVQLLWINIIMDTFAALALATDPASVALLDRKPEAKTAPLFSVDMWKQIIGQSTYQTIITLIFHFLGSSILGFHHSDNTTTQNHNNTIVQTLVFNIFVFAQIFNSINSRRLDTKLNIFAGITKNYYFMAITLIEIGVQILIVFVGGAAFQVTRVGGKEWGISLALGVVSIPLGALLRMIPNGPVEKLFIKVHLLPNPEVLPTKRPNAEWNSAIDLVRDNLSTFSHVRGGRMRASSYVGKSRQAHLPPDYKAPISSLMTMVPTLIASSIGAGWAPQSPSALSDPAHFDPSKSSAALWEGKLQIHPDTKPDDPVYTKWGPTSKRT